VNPTAAAQAGDDRCAVSVRTGQNTYPPVAGLPELRKLAAQWMNDSYQCQFNLRIPWW